MKCRLSVDKGGSVDSEGSSGEVVTKLGLAGMCSLRVVSGEV